MIEAFPVIEFQSEDQEAIFEKTGMIRWKMVPILPQNGIGVNAP